MPMKEKGVEPAPEAVPAAMVILPPMLLAALLLISGVQVA